VIEREVRAGHVRRRIVHGDTKLNNVLFDVRTKKARCVVDLDTCMAAYSLFDFGDLARFTAATASEDERDLDRVGLDLELYRALSDGYLETTANLFSAGELELMPFAARLVTFTVGVRFLTDHIAGDRYFKIGRPGQNLDRARVQFALVASMERHGARMAVRRG